MARLPGATACRHCGAPLELTVVDLGKSPLCQTVLTAEQLEQMEPFYPLHVRACERCWLVQIPQFVPPEDIFTEYAYFSAYSDSWVEHARRYVEQMTRASRPRHRTSLVVELASNDGYLLQHFLPQGHPGARDRAGAERRARRRWSAASRRSSSSSAPSSAARLAAERGRADLVLGNNVLAQVPDINDFVAGRRGRCSRRTGTATFEFPHLREALEHLEYDTIYHEHFSYFSLHAIRAIFARARARRSSTSRSCRPTAARCASSCSTPRRRDARRAAVADAARARGRGRACATPRRYRRFAEGVRESKRALLELLIGLRREGKQVVGYGAPGKGNTLLNYCGIRTDFLDYTVDRNPYKQGKHTPGTHIPIHPPEKIAETRPDVIVILPWNLARRDQRAARLHRGVGREARRPDPDGDGLRAGRRAARSGGRAMKVVIFCGGLGVRMGEETQRIPKPMIRDRQPADPLAHHALLRRRGGTTSSCSASATRATSIKEYFLNYNEALFNDFVLEGHGADARVELLERDVGTLADHVRRHRDAGDDRRAAEGRRARTSTTTRSSSRRTATGSPTRRSTEMIDAFRASRQDWSSSSPCGRSSTRTA